MEYIRYLNLVFDIIIVLCHVTTIFFTFHVIFCSKFDKKSTKLDRISNSFFIFLASRGFGAILATPYQVYLIIYWSAQAGNNYEPYAHLWLGLAMINHGYLSTLSALLLTLDRCLALTFPMYYNSRIAKCFPWLALACLILCSTFVAFYKNDVVKFTITMDVVLDIIPTFETVIFLMITGFSQTVYIGQLVTTLGFLNITVCSIYYSWRLTRKSNGFWMKISRVQQVSPVTTAT
ncbi:serpentine type 7TM GPCR chemoreceptor srbc domain-containing protein [Ditylenchus destructor]|uniref:Serpentine type 7TM GPCR chemoreceptor srbc domain-containing protein n=1 Tax=Ditylenchus destructor TaxID=166010 RepID=A0AAD4QV69_9BILA|nr:serpentine type 7TM GPCR chemoreceptor srbc domain-containing protein [Ditylenchus destructor]